MEKKINSGLSKVQYLEVETMFKEEMSQLKKWLEDKFTTKADCQNSKNLCALTHASKERKHDQYMFGLLIAILLSLGVKGVEFVGHVLKIIP